MQLSMVMDPRLEDELKNSETYITLRLRESTDFADSYVKQLGANDLKKVAERALGLLHIRRNKQARIEEDFVTTLQYLLYPFHASTAPVLIQDRSAWPTALLALSWLFRIQAYESTTQAKVLIGNVSERIQIKRSHRFRLAIPSCNATCRPIRWVAGSRNTTSSHVVVFS